MKIKKHRKVYKNCDLSGKRFGRLLVTDKFGFTGLHRHWECLCDCGKTIKVLATNIKRGNTRSCGCLAIDEGWTQRGNKSAHWKGHGDISGHIWNSIKDGAKRRGYPFNIRIEDAWVKFLEQNRKCALTGIDLFFGDRFNAPQNASLDRIDSKKGYICENIQWVHKDVNMMKSYHSVEYFVELCRAIVKYADHVSTRKDEENAES